jgi:predicted nucleotidyltransferase
LNAVIAELVSGAREILGENFCGAYLQGSFAVGDADEHSDVDFLVVVHDELTDAQQAALEALHEQRSGRSGFRHLYTSEAADE